MVSSLNVIFDCIILGVNNLHFKGVQNSENWKIINQQRLTNNKK